MAALGNQHVIKIEKKYFPLCLQQCKEKQTKQGDEKASITIAG